LCPQIWFSSPFSLSSLELVANTSCAILLFLESYATRLEFKCTNKIAECEAVLLGLQKLKAMRLVIMKLSFNRLITILMSFSLFFHQPSHTLVGPASRPLGTIPNHWSLLVFSIGKVVASEVVMKAACSCFGLIVEFVHSVEPFCISTHSLTP
jgi:hypothetical protein